MRPFERSQLLKEKEVTQDQIAEKLGITQPTVSQVINEKQNSLRVKKMYCELTGEPFEKVWK